MPLIVTPATSLPAPGADWAVVLDPTDVTTGRAELNLNSGSIRVDQRGLDWGDAAITSFMADMRIGSEAVDYRIPNRHVVVPLFLGADESGQQEVVRSYLQQKSALFQREGGLLMRRRGWGPTMYADVVNATLTLPDVWGETGEVEPNVVLTLECLPDFYGDEVSLDEFSATGVTNQVVTQAGSQAIVEGDLPGRARIVVSDSSGNDQLGMLWGLRSRYYDPAATARLVYEAEALTPLSSAAVVGQVGASGGQLVKQASLPGGSWVPILSTNLASNSPLTHRGSYRVWARCYSPTATPQFRFLWGVGSLSAPVSNAAILLPGAGNHYLLDLGEIRLDATPTGLYEWFGVVQVQAAATGDAACVDTLYFQPLDDGAGRLTASTTQQPPSSSITTTKSAGTGADNAGVGTAAWSTPNSISAQDSNVASVLIPSAGAVSHYLEATAFGFSVPAGATILGIEVDILKMGYYGTVYDAHVQLLKAGAVQATDKATVTPWSRSNIGYASTSYGGATDLWGAVWTPADINDPNFGVAISASSTGFTGGDYADVDHVSMTVYYELATGFTVAEDATIYANGSAELRYDGMFRTGTGGTAGVFGPVSNVYGDLARIPSSGMEARPVELFLKPTRGDLSSQPDAGLDSFTAQVIYRPCYIFRP